MRPTPRCSAAAASTAPSTAPAAPRSWPSAARAAGGCRPASSSTPSDRSTATAGTGSRSCSRAPTAGASRSRSSTASGRSRFRPSRPAPIASRSPRPLPSPSARSRASSRHTRGCSRWYASPSSATRTWPPTRRPSRRCPARRREARRLATPVPAWQRGEGRRAGAAERERTAMRRVLVALVLLGIVLGRPAPLRAHNAAAELGLAVGAAAGNLVYLPVKGIVALGGLVLGGVTGALTGGDVRAAYAIWVPAASGTYLLTPAKLEGTEPIEFFGSDYADQPSTIASAVEGGGIYDIQYQ